MKYRPAPAVYLNFYWRKSPDINTLSLTKEEDYEARGLYSNYWGCANVNNSM